MKRSLLVILMMLAGIGFAVAQSGWAPPTDVLGAHLNYGRGCTACHSPHSGSYGNGNGKIADARAGNRLLWGEDVASLYGKTMITDGGKFVEVLPTSLSATTPDVNGVLTCLSCHDGNYAPSAMMKNKLYEAVPASYGNSNSIPTLIGSNGAGTSSFLSEHPVGLSARINCGGSSGWDCVESNGVISMKGARSSRFVANYGFFVKPGNYSNSAVVVCTTCHNQHMMNVVTVGSGATSGLPPGNYATMFFLRAPYNPNDSNPMSNQTAQFCRQCHGDESNEMNGSTAGTVF
jgi:nitrate/TMAO reductase-like tetraheme cytochrome c subunit